MKFKKCFIFISFLILFLYVASVGASDINDTNLLNKESNENMLVLNNDYEQKLENSNNESSISYSENSNIENSFIDLKNTIETGSNEINLNKSYYYNSGGKDQYYNFTEIVIDKDNIVINGNGVKIDGKYDVFLFNITGKNVTLMNINFINFYVEQYKDIYNPICWEGADGSLINCNFKNCNFNGNSPELSGIVYWKGDNGLMANNKFYQNEGNSICWQGNYGNLIACSFSETGKIIWGKVNSNKQYFAGTNGTIAHCYFNKDSKGVLIRGINITVDLTKFIESTGMSIGNLANNCTIKNCIFKELSRTVGGAISGSSPNSTITNCVFEKNSAKTHGGAIQWTGNNLKLSNCNFTKNTALEYADVIDISGHNCIIDNCNFIDNPSKSHCGNIWWEGKNGTMSNCNFINNTMDGDHIYWKGSNGTLIYNKFINNSLDYGHNIELGANCKIINCSFINNTNTNRGAAINCYKNTIIINSTFINNLAEAGGNAIFSDYDNITIIDCIFIKNTHNNGDSAVWLYSTGNTINHFLGNTTINAGDSIKYKLPEDANGKIKIQVDDPYTLYYFNVKGGINEIYLTNLTNGSYFLFVDYYGDSKYDSISSTGYLNILLKSILPNVTVDSNNLAKFNMKFLDKYGQLLKNKEVQLKINSKTYPLMTNNNGIANLDVKLSVGNNEITYLNLETGETKTDSIMIKSSSTTTQTSNPQKVTLKTTVTLKSVTVKKSAKSLVLTATIKKGKNPIKSKQVVFKFNGKTYKAKTNSKGVVKVTIKKAVLKKLKVGKKITYTATYNKVTAKKTVKIKK